MSAMFAIDALRAALEPEPEGTVYPPTPTEVRAARKRSGMTQAQAAAAIFALSESAYRTWQSYEVASHLSEHRQIPLPAWHLFLLVTGQHPKWRVVDRLPVV